MISAHLALRGSVLQITVNCAGAPLAPSARELPLNASAAPGRDRRKAALS